MHKTTQYMHKYAVTAVINRLLNTLRYFTTTILDMGIVTLIGVVSRGCERVVGEERFVVSHIISTLVYSSFIS